MRDFLENIFQPAPSRQIIPAGRTEQVEDLMAIRAHPHFHVAQLMGFADLPTNTA